MPGAVAGYRAHERVADIPTARVAVAQPDKVAGWAVVQQNLSARVVLTEGCFAVDLRELRIQDQTPRFKMADRDNDGLARRAIEWRPDVNRPDPYSELASA